MRKGKPDGARGEARQRKHGPHERRDQRRVEGEAPTEADGKVYLARGDRAYLAAMQAAGGRF